MSTPRPWICTCAGRDKKVWHADPTCEVHGEGVAAPLEPTQPEILTFKGLNFAQWAYIVVHPSKLLDHGFKSVQQFLRELCEAYAAAVSKNLQQSFEQLCGDLKAIQQDYTNEKKRADKLQEERDKLKAELDLVDEALARRPALAHIEHRYNKIFAACAGAAKSERLEREIAALREKPL